MKTGANLSDQFLLMAALLGIVGILWLLNRWWAERQNQPRYDDVLDDPLENKTAADQSQRP